MIFPRLLSIAIYVCCVLCSTALQAQSKYRFLDRSAPKEIPSLAAILVERHGNIEYEKYYHNAKSDSAFHVMSITKSFVSAIAGAACDRGLLLNLDTTVLSVLPEYTLPSRSWHTMRGWQDNEGYDSIRHKLTLRNLLTMQTGFEWSDFGAEMDLLSSSSDPVRLTLDVPFDTLPGTVFNYCSGGATVFAAALARLVGADLLTFADSTIFQRCGIQITQWETDPERRRLGAAGLYTTPRNLLKLGELYLHDGMVGDNRVLSKSWVEQSFAKHAELTQWDVTPHVDGYGYYWWRRKSHNHEVYFASGYGGQLIYVVPDLDLVMVTVCHLNSQNRGREEIKRLHRVLDRIISVSN